MMNLYARKRENIDEYSKIFENFKEKT